MTPRQRAPKHRNTPREKVRVSVIIPTTGDAPPHATLAALGRQSLAPFEVLVIHDPDRRGSGWARNRGIERSCGDILAFTDDDCFPPDNWLERMIEAIETHDADGAGGTYIEDDPLLREIRANRGFPEAEMIDTFGHVCTTGNVVYRRESLEDLRAKEGHVFNEAFRYSQDSHLAWRLRVRGKKLVYVPTHVRHLRRVTVPAFLRLQFNRGHGIALLYRARRNSGSTVTHQSSLLWGNNGAPSNPRWIKAIWQKLVGPFNRSAFSSTRHYLLFWLGEKSECLGFLWGLVSVPSAMLLPNPDHSPAKRTRR